MSDPRAREVEYRARVHASKNEPGIESIVALLNTHIERVKSSLLRCAPAELEKLQGEASAYARVLRWINEPLNSTSIDKQ